MSGVRKTVFAVSAAGSAYVLGGYALAVAALPRRPWQQADSTPSMTLIIPAYREREALRRKLEALADLDYPAENLQVIVAIDQDEELARVAKDAFPAADVLFSPDRGGKAAALARSLPSVRGDVVVLTDANNVLEPGSLRAAARHFADPGVWAVAGRRGEAGSAYDRYEDLLRRLETRSGSVAAISGEFMAVRREHLPAFPSHVVNDDFWLLCQIVRGGGRVIYEPEAASVEEALELDAEMARRSRMSAGRVMLLSELRGLPAGFVWRAVSHKQGRLALPFLMLGALLSSLALSRRPLYRALAAGQVGVYAAGAASAAGKVPAGPASRPARMAEQLVVGNVATAVGIVRALRGRQSVRWDAVR